MFMVAARWVTDLSAFCYLGTSLGLELGPVLPKSPQGCIDPLHPMPAIPWSKGIALPTAPSHTDRAQMALAAVTVMHWDNSLIY